MWKIIASHSALKPALSTHYSALKLLRLNCVDFKDVCGPQGIDAYPTLRLYKAVLLGRYQLHWMPPLDSQFQISHILPKLGSPTWSWLCFCKHIGGLRQIIDSADSIIEFFWGGGSVIKSIFFRRGLSPQGFESSWIRGCHPHPPLNPPPHPGILLITKAGLSQLELALF